MNTNAAMYRRCERPEMSRTEDTRSLDEDRLKVLKRMQDQRITVQKGEFNIHKKGEHIPTPKEIIAQRRKELEEFKRRLENEKNQSL